MKMAIPALRQPKLVSKLHDPKNMAPVENVILTLKDDKKLLISSDSYNGIIMTTEMFKCVLCRTDMELDVAYKECHKNLASHRNSVREYPHLEEYGENLIRKLNKDCYYCTICNAIISSLFLKRHIMAEEHKTELSRAMSRASVYTTKEVNNTT